ncbi:T9SS type A sorting domain-containing protein [Flavobacterium amniphilum]|uniref:T9SS type A sorting domain-containing protein n=1 Tax=Flavobacterium amniphilum TaxID=1834035 RepID=UPI00202A1B78|nr:T9SS type A sorting domain-containing protein [Flavobacterium amniphilum]MCL9806058.1 T9SS type A sorting domain-containing protein [Flavobacterium amniphilum]
MKTIYFLVALTLSISANALTTNQKDIENPKAAKKVSALESKMNSSKIDGLKIVSYDSKKMGKHIYVVSDNYVQKKVSIYNFKGERVFKTTTVGSPIYLSKFEKGNYAIKIKEGGKTEIKELTVN